MARDFIVPELSPDGANTWRVSRPWAAYRRPAFAPMFTAPQQATGTMTVDYTLGTPAPDDAGVTPVTFKDDMSVRSDAFSEHITGDGSFEFDTRRGLVRSLTARLTAEGATDGHPYTSPITIDLILVSPDDVGRLREAARKMDADQSDRLKAAAAAEAAGRSASEALDRPGRGLRRPPQRPDSHDPTWADALDLPAGTQRTAFVGHSTGGAPFVSAGDGQRPVVGLRLRLGHWDHAMIGHVEPLYDRPTEPAAKDETVMVAKPGYAVGGLWLNGPDQADALRVIYMRLTARDAAVDPKDAYVGPWFGQVTGPDRIKAGGTGQLVVGVYGRQGLNTDALGVVLRTDPSAPATTGDPTDDPNYKGTTPAK